MKYFEDFDRSLSDLNELLKYIRLVSRVRCIYAPNSKFPMSFSVDIVDETTNRVLG